MTFGWLFDNVFQPKNVKELYVAPEDLEDDLFDEDKDHSGRIVQKLFRNFANG